jgi:hypothetical protein
MAFIESGKTFDKEKHYKKMKKLMENMDVVQYPLRIPTFLHNEVKIKLAKKRRTMRELLLTMLLNYIENEE